MSLNHITENKFAKPYFNPYFNNVKISGGADFLNSGITDLSSINGLPIPPLGLDPNPVNVIYKPGTVTTPGSNIVGTWAEVVLKAGRINVSQTLNIYFDDFVTSPCPITSSVDFNGRTYFYSASERLVNVNIMAGVTITNLRGIRGPYLYVTCSAESPVPSLAFTSVGALVNTFEVSNNSQLDTTNLTTGPVILLNDATLTIYLQNNGSLNNSGNTLQSTIQLTAVSTLYINNQYNSTFANNLVSDDGTCTYVLNSDASLLAFPTNSGITGTYTTNVIDNSSLVEYKDNLTPTFGSSVVQGALDYIKQNYQKSNSTSPMTSGAISCTSLTSSGTMSCGTNSMTCGSLSSKAITSTGNFSNGTNSSTTGALSIGSLLSSGTVSCGTNAMTCGALSSGAITSTGNFSNGTNSSTTGALSCASLLSSGTISCGTNAMTCGALSSGAITSTGNFNNGTNSSTTGSLSCASLLSSGTISCGTNAMTCGALSSGAITSTGNFSNGTNSSTTGALSCASLLSSGTISCGTNAMTCGALSSGAITSTGNFNNGTNSMTSGSISSSNTFNNGTNTMITGAISCSSVSSAGNVTQPRYWARLRLSADTAVSNNSFTSVSWTALDASFGSTSNWTISPPVTTITTPATGFYAISYSILFDVNVTGYRQAMISFNGQTRRWSQAYADSLVAPTSLIGVIYASLASGTTIGITVYQNSGGNLNMLGGTATADSISTFEVVRLSE